VLSLNLRIDPVLPAKNGLGGKILNGWYTFVHTTACLAVSPLLVAAKATDGVVGTGFGGSFGFGIFVTGVSASGSASIVADPHGDLGFAFSGGGNPGLPGVVGRGWSGGRTVTVSPAQLSLISLPLHQASQGPLDRYPRQSRSILRL